MESYQRLISPAQFAKRAAERAASRVHQDMGRGLDGLATVAATAPWVGLIGTVTGIVGSLGRGGSNLAGLISGVARGLVDACQPLALGLMVGLVSLWFYRYLTARLETFDHEMQNATLQLTNELAGGHGSRRF